VGLAASLCSDGRSRYRKYFPRLDSTKRLPPRSSFIGDSRRFSTFQNHTSPKRSNAVSEQHIRPFSCRERSSRWSASLVGLNGFNRPITASSIIAHRSTISLMIPSVVGSIQLNVRPVSLLPAFTAPEKAHIFFKMVATIDTKCMLYRGPTTLSRTVSSISKFPPAGSLRKSTMKKEQVIGHKKDPITTFKFEYFMTRTGRYYRKYLNRLLFRLLHIRTRVLYRTGKGISGLGSHHHVRSHLHIGNGMEQSS
jgi:hypothetical protein